MALTKYDKNSDAIANLYRASFYLAKGSKNVGLSFLLKANSMLGKKMTLDVKGLKDGSVLRNRSDYIYWAEKTLDEYKRLKMNLSSD